MRHDSAIRLSSVLLQLHSTYDKAFSRRKRSFHVCGSGSDFHVLATDTDGGFIVADSIQQREQATAIADLLNFAAALCGRLDKKRCIDAVPTFDHKLS